MNFKRKIIGFYSEIAYYNNMGIIKRNNRHFKDKKGGRMDARLDFTLGA